MNKLYLTNKITAFLKTGLFVAGLALGNTAQAELLYYITDLGAFGSLEPASYSRASGMNNSGQVIGEAWDGTTYRCNNPRYCGAQVAATSGFITNSSGQMISVGIFGGINDSGQVTGTVDSTPLGSSGPPSTSALIRNPNGEIISLGTLPGGSDGRTQSVTGNNINASGQVTGTSTYTGSFNWTPFNTHAFITDSNGKMKDLGVLGGFTSVGYGINDAGQVTGTSTIAFPPNPGETHAFVTDANGQMLDLGTLGGIPSIGYGINNLGQVTGSSQTADGNTHAFITDANGQMIDLGTLGGLNSSGSKINDSGQVVGNSDIADGSSHPFIVDNGVMKDLNNLLVSSATGWVLNNAADINELGQIVGTGIHDGHTRAYIMTPVPITSTLWMMVSGLLGFLGQNKSLRITKAYPKQGAGL